MIAARCPMCPSDPRPVLAGGVCDECGRVLDAAGVTLQEQHESARRALARARRDHIEGLALDAELA